MTHLRRSVLLNSLSLAMIAKAEPPTIYWLRVEGFRIEMTLEYHDGPSGNALQFLDRSSETRFCLSFQAERNRTCANAFVGSLAIARYRILSSANAPHAPRLRELVRSIDQCDQLPVRPPFERVIPFENGSASDIQVFGYKGVAAPGHDSAWCLLRQNLYLNSQVAPFLTLHWKHTLASIRVLDIIPDNGASLR